MNKKKSIVKILGNMCINNTNNINLKELIDCVIIDNCLALPINDNIYRVNMLNLKEDVTIKGNLYVDNLVIPNSVKIEIQCGGSVILYNKDEYEKEISYIF